MEKIYNDNLKINEIRYVITIGENNKNSFSRIKEKLYRLPNFNEKNVNYGTHIETFIKNVIDNNLGIDERIKVYITDYQEREGSFIIEFVVLIITTLNNFNSIKQSLDNIINGISSTIENTLDNEYKVYINSFSNPILSNYKIPSVNNIKETFFQKYNFLIIIILILISGIYAFYTLKCDKEANNDLSYMLNNKCFELLLEKKINESLSQKKIDYIFDYVKTINDSIK